MADTVEEVKDNVENELEVTDPKTGTKTHPDTVSWDQYVRTKETIGNKVTKLEEKLKSAVNAEDHSKVLKELEDTKAKLTTVESELKTFREATVTEKKKILEEKGVPKEKLEGLTETELSKINDILGDVKTKKPAPDLGGGGGGTALTGSPMSLARQAYASSNK